MEEISTHKIKESSSKVRTLKSTTVTLKDLESLHFSYYYETTVSEVKYGHLLSSVIFTIIIIYFAVMETKTMLFMILNNLVVLLFPSISIVLFDDYSMKKKLDASDTFRKISSHKKEINIAYIWLLLIGLLINHLIVHLMVINNTNYILNILATILILVLSPYMVRTSTKEYLKPLVCFCLIMLVLIGASSLAVSEKTFCSVMIIISLVFCTIITNFRVLYYKDLFSVHEKLFDLKNRNAILTEISAEITEQTTETGILSPSVIFKVIKSLKSSVPLLMDHLHDAENCQNTTASVLSIVNNCLQILGGDIKESPVLEMALDRHQESWVAGELKFSEVSNTKLRKSRGSNFSLNIGVSKRRSSLVSSVVPKKNRISENFSETEVIAGMTGHSIRSIKSHAVSKKSRQNSQTIFKDNNSNSVKDSQDSGFKKDKGHKIALRTVDKTFLSSLEAMNLESLRLKTSKRDPTKWRDVSVDGSDDIGGTPSPHTLDNNNEVSNGEVSNGTKETLSLSSLLTGLDSWNFDIFEFSQKSSYKPLQILCQLIFQRIDIYDGFSMSPTSINKLQQWLLKVESTYDTNLPCIY